MDVTRERNSCILELREILLSFQTGDVADLKRGKKEVEHHDERLVPACFFFVVVWF